jgi:hypothetical protein
LYCPQPYCQEEHSVWETIQAASELGAGIDLAIHPAQPTDKNGMPVDL